MEADQHAALLADVTHRQARATTVAPGRTFDRPQQAFGFHLTEVPKAVLENSLLDRHLCSDVQVLHPAAATGSSMQAEVLARRPHALRTLFPQRGQGSPFPLVLAPQDAHLHEFAGQSAIDEDDLAVRIVGDALCFTIQRFDPQPIVGIRHGPRLSRPRTRGLAMPPAVRQ